MGCNPGLHSRHKVPHRATNRRWSADHALCRTRAALTAANALARKTTSSHLLCSRCLHNAHSCCSPAGPPTTMHRVCSCSSCGLLDSHVSTLLQLLQTEIPVSQMVWCTSATRLTPQLLLTCTSPRFAAMSVPHVAVSQMVWWTTATKLTPQLLAWFSSLPLAVVAGQQQRVS